MKGIASLKERSPLSRGGRGVAALLFLALGGIACFAGIEPAWAKWVVLAGAVSGLVTVALWKAPAKDEAVSEEEIVEIARRAIKTEATRLDAKRRGLEKVLMAYGEWMEFPDFQTLQTIDWKDEAHVAMDARVAALLDNEADLMLQRFSSGVYWTSGKFEARQLLLDLASFTEAIARIYRPESDLPLLELNLESLFKAINRASLQIILLIEELPVLEVKEMNLRKVSENIRKASKVYRKYEELQPYLKPVRYLWHSSKMLIASNPLLAAGWIAGSELMWKGGMHLGKKAMDAYLLSLVRQTLGIVAWETAGIYDRTHRYRSPDWVYGVELAHLLSKFEATQEILRETFRELGKLPLRSTYDRVFLYRCIAQNASPKPSLFAQPELLPVATRFALREQLLAFYEKHISANAASENAAVQKWRAGLEERLGL
ncbi:MAG: hypothetical protein GXX91_06545 [Verrucomicrobiaceae bacterium]|nr:hypothetical protein [Verrucomicrobiaceae bacterium]